MGKHGVSAMQTNQSEELSMQIISKHLIWTLTPIKIIQSITRPILQPSISGKLAYARPEEKWNKLERELSKKTRLKREKLDYQIGKYIVYVDVDNSNMYEVMKENN